MDLLVRSSPVFGLGAWVRVLTNSGSGGPLQFMHMFRSEMTFQNYAALT